MKYARANRAKNCNFDKLAALLDQIDPDLFYGEWLRVMMAIFYETGGSEEGFELADAWCSKGRKYPGSRAIRSKWNSFSLDQDPPITIGTLIWMTRQKP